jgi:hypothetical protein
MIGSYGVLKKAAAIVNHQAARLGDEQKQLICQVCDEILAKQHTDQFPLHVWMTGSGTQFNMNVNEVISNRCCQIAGTPLGSKTPVHPNDHVNMSQSSNDSFPSAMYIAAAQGVHQRLIPAVKALRDALNAKAEAWKNNSLRFSSTEKPSCPDKQTTSISSQRWAWRFMPQRQSASPMNYLSKLPLLLPIRYLPISVSKDCCIRSSPTFWKPKLKPPFGLLN